MIVTLVLIALLQDGPIRTAPEPSLQESAVPRTDPGPACTFGGRPVSSPGCPPPRGRIAFEATAPQVPAGTADEDDNPWAVLNRADRGQATTGEGGYSRGAAAVPESGVPGWALLDPARWETSQCGTAGDDACRRQARNRLAMARAGLATEAPSAGSATAPDNCRMVMRRSETGFGGSLSRVCGDGAEVEATLDRLEGALRPAVEPCDRPASLETQEAWIARCRSLPPR